jgi:cholesterol oxidase
LLETEYFAGHRALLRFAARSGFPLRQSPTEFGDFSTKIPMGLDWDVVREEVVGTKVPSCIHAEAWYGMNSGAKRSLDGNYLKLAEESGHVEIRPLHSVTDVAERPGGGYRVSYERPDESGEVLDRGTLTCSRLFLGAGTLGTCRLLFRAKARGTLPRLSEQLGEGFGDDGDRFFQWTGLAAKTNPHLGPPGVVAVCNYKNPIQPCVLMRLGLPRYAVDYPDKDSLALFVFAHTANRGRLRYDAGSDDLHVDFTPDADDAVRHLAEHLRRKNGGELQPVASRVTGHQLGGACMGSVCDLHGQARGHPGLYVVDGALLPGSSTCTNPALTIAAVAERCLDRILETNLRR